MARSSRSNGNGNGKSESNPAEPPIIGKVGEIVLVRVGKSQSVPAIIVNDFAGQNAPGTVSICVFVADQYGQNTSPVKFIASAQHETDAIPNSVLINEPCVWWRGMEESERDLTKEESPAP